MNRKLLETTAALAIAFVVYCPEPVQAKSHTAHGLIFKGAKTVAVRGVKDTAKSVRRAYHGLRWVARHI